VCPRLTPCTQGRRPRSHRAYFHGGGYVVVLTRQRYLPLRRRGGPGRHPMRTCSGGLPARSAELRSPANSTIAFVPISGSPHRWRRGPENAGRDSVEFGGGNLAARIVAAARDNSPPLPPFPLAAFRAHRYESRPGDPDTQRRAISRNATAGPLGDYVVNAGVTT